MPDLPDGSSAAPFLYQTIWVTTGARWSGMTSTSSPLSRVKLTTFEIGVCMVIAIRGKQKTPAPAEETSRHDGSATYRAPARLAPAAKAARNAPTKGGGRADLHAGRPALSEPRRPFMRAPVSSLGNLDVSARHILTLSCANRPGIVARVSASLFEGGFNILDAQQFDDTLTGFFFMRVEFNAARSDADAAALAAKFEDIGADFKMDWSMRPADRHKKVALMVSRFDHCLMDLLYRWRSGEMPMQPVAIIANYPRETYAHIEFGDIPFHYLPITRQTKMEQEAQVWETIKASGAELVVLARYMQILSDGLAAKMQGGASTSTTRSCPASRAPSPIIRRMSGA